MTTEKLHLQTVQTEIRDIVISELWVMLVTYDGKFQFSPNEKELLKSLPKLAMAVYKKEWGDLFCVAGSIEIVGIQVGRKIFGQC